MKRTRPVIPVLAAVVLTAIVAAALGGCGDSGGSDGGEARAGDVKTAEKIVKLTEEDLLYGPTYGVPKVSELRAPTEKDVHAFPYEVKSGAPGKVAIVLCSNLSQSCVHRGELIEAFFELLNIETFTTYSDYTPAGNQRAMNSALAWGPDAIIAIAVAPGIAPQLAQAKKEGIPVTNGVGSPKTNEPGFDAYVRQSSTLFNAAYAVKMIEETEGSGNILWLNAREFPQLETEFGVEFLRNSCAGCSVEEGTETAAQVTAPVPMSQLITSSIRANPNLDFLVLASACADVQAAASAVRESGTGVKLGGPECGAAAVGAMNSGYLAFANGQAEPWAALQMVDQTLRMISGEPPLKEEETGPAIYMVTPESTPDKSKQGDPKVIDAWTLERFDYMKPYEEAWGVDLRPAIE